MSEQLTRWLTLVAVVGAGVVAGVFFAFSTFVMKALADLPPTQGLRAMQSINVAAPNPLFMVALFGTTLPIAALVVASLGDASSQTTVLRLVAAGGYLATVGLTVAFHVPHNDALALVDPDSAQATGAWSSYLVEWTRWNHVRTVGAVVAAAALTWSMQVR